MFADSSKKQKTKTGSPDKGEPIFLIIGRIRKPHGVKGEVLFEVITDFPERIKEGITIFIGAQKKEYKVESIRTHQSHLLLKLHGLNTCEDVEQFRNQMVYVRTANIPKLPENEYYHHELIGMSVLEDGKLIGDVREVLETGANDVLVVMVNQDEILIPFIKQVILNVDKKEKTISVKMQEWK